MPSIKRHCKSMAINEEAGTQKQDVSKELAQFGKFEHIIKYKPYQILHPISSYINTSLLTILTFNCPNLPIDTIWEGSCSVSRPLLKGFVFVEGFGERKKFQNSVTAYKLPLVGL